MTSLEVTRVNDHEMKVFFFEQTAGKLYVIRVSLSAADNVEASHVILQEMLFSNKLDWIIA